MHNIFRRKPRGTPGWAERGSRPRVLVENPDVGVGFALERFLEAEGCEVAVCGGPDRLRRHRCPLVFDEDCALAAGADVIVHGLNPDRPEHAEVLRALRAKHPSTPLVVEVTNPTAARHAGLLADCVVVPFPATRGSLRGAVDRALARD
ncbi:MAG TPA: hypothetical protein VMX12_01115 [Acidimicrobiia bacterium]|nr:hypothetical protein [Acidimicrobiia bacterium]